ncbi:MAG: hypothetical protein ABIQ08_14585 [Duganella sp.]
MFLAYCFRPTTDIRFYFRKDFHVMNFPFEPRSTSYLRQGQYWSFQLSNGHFACGLVLARTTLEGKLNRTLFLGGLLNWSGPSLPTPSNLKKAGVLQSGFMHIRAIQRNGGKVHGEIEETWDVGESEVVYTGLTTNGPPIWGYAYIRALAEQHFGGKGWSDKQLNSIRDRKKTA